MEPGEGFGHTIDEVARALVRPLVTIIFATSFVILTFNGVVSGEVFASVSGMIFAFWFSSRNQEKTDEQTKTLQTAIVSKIPEGTKS